MRILIAWVCITVLALLPMRSFGSGADTPQLKDAQDMLAPYRTMSFRGVSIRRLETKFPMLHEVLLPYAPEDRARILSLMLAYFDSIHDLAYKKHSAAFLVQRTWIYYDEARMTSEAYLGDTEYKSIFYPYPLQALTHISPPSETLDYTRPLDFYQALLGVACCTRSMDSNRRISTEIAHDTREHVFLGRRVRMHPIAGKALQAVDADLRTLRTHDATVDGFLTKLQHAFGYANKTVLYSNNSNISMHALGLAVDIIPRSYEGKQVYWVWTRNNYPKRWKSLPLEKRWSVPHAIVAVFQKHGFIWGGKWNNFDTIHFEYRPEIILYARMRAMNANTVYHETADHGD